MAQRSPALVIVALAGAGLLVIGGVVRQIEPTLFGVRAVPLTIIGLYVVQRAVERRTAYPWLLARLIVLGTTVAGIAVFRAIRVQATMPLLQEVHRAGRIWTFGPFYAFGPHGHLDDLIWLEANTVEGQQVFLFPDKGGMYFLSRTRNSTSYPVLFDMGMSSNAQVADAVQQLVRKCPAIGIWHRTRLFSVANNRPDQFTLKPLEQILLRDYDVVAEFANGATALRRKSSSSGCKAMTGLSLE